MHWARRVTASVKVADDSIHNTAEWRKPVILLQEVDIRQLAISSEQAAQWWTLESAENR